MKFEEDVLDEDVNSSSENTHNEIEIIADDGSTLNISEVSDNINIVKKDEDKPKNIVIPQEKK